jgi:hypothetical protein
MDSVIPMMLGCGDSELDWHLVQTYFVFLFGRLQGPGYALFPICIK